MKRCFYYFLIMAFCNACLFAKDHTPVAPIKSKSVVIIGSGVGALTSAIYLQRAGIDTIVMEGRDPGGAIAQSPMVHNWPGEIAIDGQVLIDKIRKQAEFNGAKILSKEVIKVDFSKLPYLITVRDVIDHSIVETYETPACIIAMGSMPKLLGIPGESGEKGYWTKGVYSCAVCDGSLYRDKVVAVIGGGDTAVLEADYLAKIAKKVYVILRSDHFRTVEILRKNELLKKPNVEILYNTNVKQIEGDGKKVTHLNLSTSKQLEIDGVFVAIGSKPNSEILLNHLQLDEYGYVKLSNGQETSMSGVFAIGDVVDPHYKQAVSAAGDGAKAALQVERFLATPTVAVVAKPIPKRPHAKIAQAEKQQLIVNNIDELTGTNSFYSAVGKNITPVVVIFYSPYCGNCKKLNSQIDHFAYKFQGRIRFLKVDVTQYSQIASSYNVYGLPALMLFDTQGNTMDRASGMEPCIQFLNNLDAYIAQK